MIKRTFKRTLSIFLTLVLIATTFFIFDPSVLKLSADAYVDTEPNALGKSMADSRATAPETIYLNPANDYFQYFSLINPDTGAASDSTSATGTVEFKNGDAWSIKLYVNNFWKKTAQNIYSDASSSLSSLTLSGQSVTKAGISATTAGPGCATSGKTPVASASSNLSFNLVPGTSKFTGAQDGEVFIIEWCVEYITGPVNAPVYHYTFLYTGIYKPSIQITGVTGMGRETGTGNTPEMGGFAFIAGAMKYAEKGNRSHIYTSRTAGTNAAPLVLFNGSTNGGTASISNSSTSGYYNTTNFPESGTKTIQVNTTTPNADPCQYYTKYTDYGSYTNPNPTGTNQGNTNAATGTYSGVAYMVVDTSRFTNYSQIPYLSVGYVKYYGVNGGYSSSLDYIRAVDSSLSNSGNYNISAVGVDTGDHNELNGQARTYGLYKLSGGIYNGGFMLEYKYNHGINLYLGHNTFDLKLGVGLHTTTVNKDGIRKAYCDGLTSVIDKTNYGDSYSTYYNNMMTQARLLCDPTATSGTVSVSADDVKAANDSIIAANTAAVLTFYVPELIYLTPSTGNMNTFKYYVDRENAVDGALRTGEQTSGNVYLKVDGATSVSVKCSGATVNGKSAGTELFSGTSSISGSITSGTLATAIAQNTTSRIEWTATYVLNGATYETKAYSTVYAPLCSTSSTLGCQAVARRKDSDKDASCCANGTCWVVGIHEIITTTHGEGTGDQIGGMIDPPLVDSAVTKKDEIGRNDQASNSNVLVWTSGTGYRGYWANNSASGKGDSHPVNVYNYYEGNIWADCSRYTNLNQIPYLKAGVDIQECYSGTGDANGNRSVGVYTEGGTENSTNIVSWASSGWSSGALNGTRHEGKINIGIDGNDKNFVVMAVIYKKPNWDYHARSQPRNYLHYKAINKAELREALNKEISTGKNQSWYTSSTWTDYENALKTAADALGNPKANQTTVNNAKSAINQKATALKKISGSVSAIHVGTNGVFLGKDAAKTYNYGDTVKGGVNEYVGYTYQKGYRNYINLAEEVANTNSSVLGSNSLTWDAATAKLTFTTTGSGTDNYSAYPGPGADISPYYYVPVTPGSTMTLSYTATGPTAQAFVFFAGSDKKTFSGDPWLACSYATGNVNLTVNIPSNCYYVTFRFGNQTPNSTTVFSNMSFSKNSEDFTATEKTIPNVTTPFVDFKFVYTPNTTVVKYDPDGGKFSDNSTAIKTGTPATYDANYTVGSGVTVPTKAGYTFTGWDCSVDGKVDNGYVFTPWRYDTPEVTFKALWTANAYNLVYNANGGSTVSGADLNVGTYGYSETATLKNATDARLLFTRTGYVQTGWDTLASGGTTYTIPETGTVTADVNAFVDAQGQQDNTGVTINVYAHWTIGTVKIAYDVNGGLLNTAPATATATYNQDFTISSTVPTRIGWTFQGWDDTEAKNNPKYNCAIEGEKVIPANVINSYYNDVGNGNTKTLYAVWTINSSTLNVNPNTGSWSYNGTTYTSTAYIGGNYNTEISIPNPVKEGYRFKGWTFTEGTAEGSWTSSTAKYKYGKVNGGTDTLTANWEIYKSTLIVDPNGGTYNGTTAITKYENKDYNTTQTVDDPTWTGHTFTGWTKSANFAGTLSGTTYTFKGDGTKDDTLTANWTINSYTISFNSNGGSGTMNNQSVTYGNHTTITANAFTRTGYTYSGWTVGSTSGAAVANQADTDSVYATLGSPANGGSVTLYAKWTPKTYTIAFNGNGNTSGSMSNQSVTYGSGTKINANAFAKTGYHFVEWTVGSTSGAAVANQANTDTVYATLGSPSGNTVTLYAKWAANTSTLVVNPNGGTYAGTTSNTTYSNKNYNSTQSIAIPTRTGYKFNGWTKTFDSTKASAFNGTLPESTTAAVTYTFGPVNGAVDTITAKWVEMSITLAYNANGGTGAPANQTLTYNSASSISSTKPTKTGYEFLGWAASSTAASATYTAGQSLPAGTVNTLVTSTTGDTLTLYAVWSVRQYTLTVNPNGGTWSGSTAAQTFTADFGSTKTIANPDARTGYTFANWSLTETGKTTAGKGTLSGTTYTYGEGNDTLTANWTINKHNINLYAYGNTASAATTWAQGNGGTVKINSGTAGATATLANVDYNTSVTYTAAANTGWTFKGWYKSNSNWDTSSNQAVSTTATYSTTMPDANVVYYAKFDINTYTASATAVANTAAAQSTYNAATAGTENCTVTISKTTGIYYNTTITLTATAPAAYSFEGWYTDSGLTEPAISTSATYTPAITSNMTYYAKFSVKQFALTATAAYNTSAAKNSYTAGTTGGTVKINGGTTSPVNVYYKATATLTATPAAGYQFDGWLTSAPNTWTEATTGETGDKVVTMGAANATWYAKFSVVTPTLKLYAYSNTGNSSTYSNNTTGGTVKIASGTAGKEASLEAAYNATPAITATPAAGYTFSGWYKTATFSGSDIVEWGTAYSGANSEAMTTARTYYAKFTAKSFKVNLSANGGSGDGSMTVYYNDGAAITASPSRSGFEFLGWSDNASATSATYGKTSLTQSEVNSLFTKVNSSNEVTIYAVWRAYEYTTHVLAVYNTAAAQDVYKVGTTGGTAVLNSGVSTIKTGETITSKIKTTPATGYELTKIMYANTESVPSEGSTVSTNWGTYNTTENPTLPGFGSDATVVYIAYFSVKTFTIKAKAMSNSVADTTTYNNNSAGGTVKCGQDGTPDAVASINVAYGDANGATFYAAPKTGYTFDGWYSNEPLNDTNKVSTAESLTVVADSSTAASGEIVRYAKFSIATYTASGRAKYYTNGYDYYFAGAEEEESYGLNGIVGGTVTVKAADSAAVTTTNNNAVSVSAKYNEIVTYKAKEATGYEFVGWYYSDSTDDNVDIVSGDVFDYGELDENGYWVYEFAMPAQNVRLHAKFVPINFILVLNPNTPAGASTPAVSGPTAEVTLTYNKDAALDSSAKPTCSGFQFVGWAETPTATTAAYDHTNSNCTISYTVVNSWFNNGASHEIYAVWSVAKYIVNLDNQGGEGGLSQVEVTLGQALPTLTSLPTYTGYKLDGYFTEPGGEGVAYYTASGTGTKNWDIADGATLYAKWICPVLKDATYDPDTGKWTYTYEGTNVPVVTDTEMTDPQDITDNAPSGAEVITSLDKVETKDTENKVAETADIDLNHYTEDALEALLPCVTATNTADKREKLSQPALNAKIAEISYHINLTVNDEGNKKTTEKVAPSIKLYETKSKLAKVNNNVITEASDSATGVVYDTPISTDAATYVYPGKWSEHEQEGVDYLIYTNSRNPVIALELDDGEVATSVESNNSSYPTKIADISAECDPGVADVSNVNDTYATSAVKATDDITKAWFYKYTQAGIGVGDKNDESSLKAHDYNAKTILYLTPEFTTDNVIDDANEVVYTIKPSDDATVGNEGFSAASIADVKSSDAGFYAFNEANQPAADDEITICVTYHNAMNGTSDEGGGPDDPYLQFYTDQVNADSWLRQMHLFRTSGGADNWEIVQAGEDIYPVDDPTFGDLGYTFGEFAYVFDSTLEPEATSYAEAGDYALAKKEIIKSLRANPSETQNAIKGNGGTKKSFLKHFDTGLIEITNWSWAFYPKENTYIYAHLIDRWGNEFNKIFKSFKVDEYASTISGSSAKGFTVNETGGSNISSFQIEGDFDFITDIDSAFEDGTFTTVGNTFIISTGKPKTKLPFTVLDNAGNPLSGKIPTDTEGNIKFTVNDDCMDLTSGAYTFTFNGKQVNLYARDPAIVRDASIAQVVMGDTAIATVKTSSDAAKVQLIENGETRTFYEGKDNVESVVDNGDGTKTWKLKVIDLKLGQHEFAVKGKSTSGVWHDSPFVLKTLVIDKAISLTEAQILSVEILNKEVKRGDAAELKVITNTVTSKLQFVLPGNTTMTVSKEKAQQVTENGDGTLTWIISKTFDTLGQNEVVLKAKGETGWTEAQSYGYVSVVKDIVKGAVIYSVTPAASEVKRNSSMKLEVVTNAETTKIQFVLPGTTSTFSPNSAEIVDNGDGTKTWTVKQTFCVPAGEMELKVLAKSATGWNETAQTFGTITVK